MARFLGSVEAAIPTEVALWMLLGRLQDRKVSPRLWERWEPVLVCSSDFKVGSPSSVGLPCCLVSCLFQPLTSGSSPHPTPATSRPRKKMGKQMACVFFQWPFKHLTLGAAVDQVLRA